jgi:hypothetical protein
MHGSFSGGQREKEHCKQEVPQEIIFPSCQEKGQKSVATEKKGQMEWCFRAGGVVRIMLKRRWYSYLKQQFMNLYHNLYAHGFSLGNSFCKLT